MTWKFASILPVWFLAIVGAVLVATLSPSHNYFEWLGIVLAGTTVGTFIMQLAVPRKEGFVLRVMASVAGSVLILGIATALLAALGA